MSTFEEQSIKGVNMHTVAVCHGEIQLGKGQDFSATGEGMDAETNEPYTWAIEADGHGTNTIINRIREKVAYLKENGGDPTLFMNQRSPSLALQEELGKTRLFKEASGSTFICAKIYKNRVFIESVGDSFVYVLKNGEPIWKNKLHKWDNPEEKERLSAFISKPYAQASTAIKVIAPDTMCQISSPYIVFSPYGRSLALTQALGHDNMTCIKPNTVTIEFEPGQEYKIIAVSDGVCDMIMQDDAEEMAAFYNMSHEEILQFAESRWKQEWFTGREHAPHIKSDASWYFTEREHFDDISCFVAKIEANK